MGLREGRFGPYVTDGAHNATLRKSDGVEELTDERDAQLPAERHAHAPDSGVPRPTRTSPTSKRIEKQVVAVREGVLDGAAICWHRACPPGPGSHPERVTAVAVETAATHRPRL